MHAIASHLVSEISPQGREGPVQLSLRVWHSILTTPFIVRVAAVTAILLTFLIAIAAVTTNDIQNPIDVLFGIRSPFDPGPWQLMLPISILGYLAVPAIVGLLVSLAVERATVAAQISPEVLQEQIIRELHEQLLSVNPVDEKGHSDDDPSPI